MGHVGRLGRWTERSVSTRYDYYDHAPWLSEGDEVTGCSELRICWWYVISANQLPESTRRGKDLVITISSDVYFLKVSKESTAEITFNYLHWLNDAAWKQTFLSTNSSIPSITSLYQFSMFCHFRIHSRHIWWQFIEAIQLTNAHVLWDVAETGAPGVIPSDHLDISTISTQTEAIF